MHRREVVVPTFTWFTRPSKIFLGATVQILWLKTSVVCVFSCRCRLATMAVHVHGHRSVEDTASAKKVSVRTHGGFYFCEGWWGMRSPHQTVAKIESLRVGLKQERGSVHFSKKRELLHLTVEEDLMQFGWVSFTKCTPPLKDWECLYLNCTFITFKPSKVRFPTSMWWLFSKLFVLVAKCKTIFHSPVSHTQSLCWWWCDCGSLKNAYFVASLIKRFSIPVWRDALFCYFVKVLSRCYSFDKALHVKWWFSKHNLTWFQSLPWIMKVEYSIRSIESIYSNVVNILVSHFRHGFLPRTKSLVKEVLFLLPHLLTSK